MVKLDHILWAAPDLDAGAEAFAELTGVMPAPGGSHPGHGTRNALASLGRGVYLEIIAPDPAQKAAGERGRQIAALPHPRLLTFGLNSNDLGAVVRVAERLGLEIRGPLSMSRERPDAPPLHWQIVYLRHSDLGEAVPFVIDWGSSLHPSATAPEGCRLHAFTAFRPEPEPLLGIYRAFDVPVEVKRAYRPGFLAVLETPKGDVVLQSC